MTHLNYANIMTAVLPHCFVSNKIRIFPDGPDEENKGNVALFLHCTTADHLARVKARFLIEGQVPVHGLFGSLP